MNPAFRMTAPLGLALIALPNSAMIRAQDLAPANRPVETGVGATPYADLVDLITVSPVIADATIRSATRLKGADAAGVAPGRTRFYVEADVTALVRGADGLPPRIGYLFDAAPAADGALPRLKKARVLVFAKPVPSTPGQVQLVALDGQRAWNAADDQRIRQIARDLVAPDAPPVITGVGNAFHVPGALPGEGETQVFLTTANGAPVSLSILRRPGEQPRWAVALSEIVDEAAAPPARDTLLWYRLACSLPPALPAHSTASLDATNAATAREDYAFVLARLGPCGRIRTDPGATLSGGGAPA